MKSTIMHKQHYEALANRFSYRLLQGLALPGLGRQLLLALAVSGTFGWPVSVAVMAGDEPPTVVAALPDDGQPPAPDAVQTEPKAEPTAIAIQAEVTTDEQVEQTAVEVPQASEPAHVRELSVQPAETRPLLPPDRPAWVGAANETSERVHRLYVASFTTNHEEEVHADEALDEPLVAAVQRYLDETVFPGQGASKLMITAEFIRQNLLDKSTSYVAAMTTQSGTEYQKWVVLQVTPEHRDYFSKQLQELKQRQRMSILGLGLGGLLGFIGLTNLAFNRRRQRYPNTVTPITMAIMPVHGHDNLQQVAAGAAPVALVDAPRKKRSILRKTLILMVCAGLVFALMVPALTIVKVEPRKVHRINLNGQVFEIETHQPNIREMLSDHD